MSAGGLEPIEDDANIVQAALQRRQVISPPFAVTDTAEVKADDQISPCRQFAGQDNEFALVTDAVDDPGVEDDDRGRRIFLRPAHRLSDGSYERLARTNCIDVLSDRHHGASHVVIRPMAASGSCPTVSRSASTQG